MHRESVDLMLANYRETLARCGFLEKQIPVLEQKAASMRKTMVEDSIYVAQSLSGMPHGTNISDPTARVAVKFASGEVTDEVRQIEEEIVQKRCELVQKQTSVAFVEAWLESLNAKERLIIERQVIDKLYWREVVRHYEVSFGEIYSKHALKDMRDKAMQKIYRIAQ